MTAPHSGFKENWLGVHDSLRLLPRIIYGVERPARNLRGAAEVPQFFKNDDFVRTGFKG